MEPRHTTAMVQRFLSQLDGDAPAEPIVRDLLAQSVGRLEKLCASMLYRRYPRLARPPLNLQPEEMLSLVVERLLKAMRETRPPTVRRFFAMANQHIRWELNDLARRLDEHTRSVELREETARAPEDSGSTLSPTALRILETIEQLPEEEREIFDLVRIQGLTHAEAAEIVGVSEKTVQRRLHRGLLLLSTRLDDLRPAGPEDQGAVMRG